MFNQGAKVLIGKLAHTRFRPETHHFKVPMGCYMVPLVGTENEINRLLNLSSIKARFKRKNYLDRKDDIELATLVLQEASKLSGKKIEGNVYLLGQLQSFGIYFSPVNFYIIGAENSPRHLFAEVTNTPWNEKHYYLLDLKNKKTFTHKKEFHVSPFNPMDMGYQWRIELGREKINIGIEISEEKKTFNAELKLRVDSSRKSNLAFMNLRIIWGIYSNAFKLFFLKKLPFYDHPSLQEAKNEYR